MKAFVQTCNEESGKMVLQSCIDFSVLDLIAQFTYRTRPEWETNISNKYNYEGNTSYYQRDFDQKHLNEMVDYLSKSILDIVSCSSYTAIFPTAMLLAFETEENLYAKVNREGIIDFQQPRNVMVVDGQHRLRAMKILFERVYGKTDNESLIIQNYIKNYKFNCTILVNFDMWEQAKIFADVNFKQKKVSKSLFYEIYGMYYDNDTVDSNQSALYLAHQLVVHLNCSEYSPLKNCIKMLGNKEKGFLSQSFLVEALIAHFKPGKVWHYDSTSSISEDFVFSKAFELTSYLTVFKNVFSSIWPESGVKKVDYVICKTTGMGALIKLMADIHKVLPSAVLSSLKNQEEDGINDEYVKNVTPYIEKLAPQQDRLFSTDPEIGDYCSASGLAAINSLYKELYRIIFSV